MSRNAAKYQFYCTVCCTVNFSYPASGIQDKAGRWLGCGVALSDANEAHKFWFLVGEPETDKLKRATEKALNLLYKIGPNKVEIVREQEREAFSEELAAQLQAHESL